MTSLSSNWGAGHSGQCSAHYATDPHDPSVYVPSTVECAGCLDTEDRDTAEQRWVFSIRDGVWVCDDCWQGDQP